MPPKIWNAEAEKGKRAPVSREVNADVHRREYTINIYRDVLKTRANE